MRHFENFNLSEVFVHCTDNEITDCVTAHYIDSLLVLLHVLQEFRNYVDTPIRITSGYRGKAHNALVGGSSTSQHRIGQAIDFQPINMPFSTFQIFFREWLTKTPLRGLLGQIIIYKSFIHMGLRCHSHKTLTIYEKRNN